MAGVYLFIDVRGWILIIPSIVLLALNLGDEWWHSVILMAVYIGI